MLDHLSQISADPERSQCFKCRTLCHTIAGNPVPLVTITSSSASLEESKVCGVTGSEKVDILMYIVKESCSCHS